MMLVFIGGGIGAAVRYWLSGLVYDKFGSGFPYGTIVVNVLGCLLIGLLMTGMQERFLVQSSLRIFLTIGILGGFTTFSSFSYETVLLLRDGELFTATINVIGTVFTCMVATWIGMQLGKLL